MGERHPIPLANARSERMRFGSFEVDLCAGELRKSGLKIKLPPQPFEVLAILLERPGEVVTREQLQQKLWASDTIVDFENGLNKTINKLREALGDVADTPRFIETLPRHGYRFIAPLAHPAPTEVAVSVLFQENSAPAPSTSKNKRGWWIATLGIAGVCALAVAAFYWFRSSSRTPRVLAYRQLTADRQEKGLTPCGWNSIIATDGLRVFFSEPGSTVAQVASGGGDTVRVSTPFTCFRIFDISPDKTELIGAQENSGAADQPLWSLSTTSGLAHRLGNLIGHSASWSPDGQKFAYVAGNSFSGPNDLYIAPKNGNEAWKLVTIPRGYVDEVRWSPDGRALRLVVSRGLWEVAADGTNLHKIVLFPDEDRPIAGINWTADGKYFVFRAMKPNSMARDVWVRRETKSLFRSSSSNLVQLTTGGTSFGNPVPSPDGKHIFAFGGQYRGELVRYDIGSGKLDRFLSGLSADQLDFSRDGKWVAYVTFPEGILWRSRVDGSERMPLTDVPLRAATPHWSPDGTRVAFSGGLPGRTWNIYVVQANGGKLELVYEAQANEFDPTWSPDGNSLVFASDQTRLVSVDLRTGRSSAMPGSEGMYSPRISPDGRFVVAKDAPGSQKLLLFDQQTRKWSELMNSKAQLNWQQWSNDSKSVFVVDFTDHRAPAFYRIRVADHKVEPVARFEVPDGTTGFWIGWAGIAPNGSPLALRDLSLWEVYALDVDLP